jgi:uncharacterized membrane protein (DUF2068 family)
MAPMKSSETRVLRLIASFKFVKAALLIAVGVGAFHLLHKEVDVELEHWVRMCGLDPGNRYIDKLLDKAGELTPHHLGLAGAASLIYAALFLVEGTGLWMAKRWGEWVTIIITSSLIPFEIYELVRHPNWMKIAVLIINVAVVIYLIYRVGTTEPNSV